MNSHLKLTIIVAVIVIGICGAASKTYHWYYQRYVWPSQIQQNLFGQSIADANMLLKREGETAYGQGLFRWSYRIDPKNERLTQFCGLQPIEKCRFTRFHRAEPNVDQDASYANGVLTLEEWWK